MADAGDGYVITFRYLRRCRWTVVQFVDDDLPVVRRDHEPEEIPVVGHVVTVIDQKKTDSTSLLTGYRNVQLVRKMSGGSVAFA